MGIFVGVSLGLSFWSALDSVGQEQVPVMTTLISSCNTKTEFRQREDQGRPENQGGLMHPLTRQVLDLIEADPRTLRKIARRAGVDPDMFSSWKRDSHQPRLHMIEAVLGALGYKLEIENGPSAFEAKQSVDIGFHEPHEQIGPYVQDTRTNSRVQFQNLK